LVETMFVAMMSPMHSITLHHADEHLLVVEKPAGLLSVPGRLPELRDCLIARVQVDFPDALTVHRLDQVTSGLVVIARGATMQRALSMQFERRQVAKGYEALVEGLLREDAGEIDLPLICDWPNRPRQKVDHAIGKLSLTRWRVLARDPAASTTRLALEPVTGRSHQLRVHLASIGHPIVGDAFYGAAPAGRVCLHAGRLGLAHPATGARHDWVSPAPFRDEGRMADPLG
jgi:tRNA pseudouridine32 synthase/23S rRNA pseudouridine746 synthase